MDKNYEKQKDYEEKQNKLINIKLWSMVSIAIITFALIGYILFALILLPVEYLFANILVMTAFAVMNIISCVNVITLSTIVKQNHKSIEEKNNEQH